MKRTVTVQERSWSLRKPFIIARSARNETHTIEVRIDEDGLVGRGEATPTPRYDETMSSVRAALEAFIEAMPERLTRDALLKELAPGAARNALDLALWDLEAKRSKADVGTLTGLGWPREVKSVQTISISPPDEMGREAYALRDFPILKVKLNEENVLERVSAVHQNAPNVKLIVDANESWSFELLVSLAPQLAALGVEMIEQPLSALGDGCLSDYCGPVPIFADESCHTRKDLPRLKGRYDGINIKLDKAGGLTEAIALLKEARALGFDVMLGCMMSSSLGIAPAMLIAPYAKYVDVDAPQLLSGDRKGGIEIRGGEVSDLNPRLWGGRSMGLAC